MARDAYGFPGIIDQARPYFKKNKNEYRISHISNHNVRTIAREIYKNFPDKSELDRYYKLALYVLHVYFGAEWMKRYIIDVRRNTFFEASVSSEITSTADGHRTRDLAELVLNMSRCPGIEAPFAELADGKIESSYSELLAGKILKTYSSSFRFVLPCGKKGQNYDIELKSRNGKIVCADVKLKLDGQAFVVNGLTNSLKDAIDKNLPKNRPCMIFIKIPQGWFEDKYIKRRIIQAIKGFLNTTKRVVLIVTYSSRVISLEKTSRLVSDLAILQTSKPFTIFGPELIWRLKVGPTPIRPIGWHRLADYFPEESRVSFTKKDKDDAINEIRDQALRRALSTPSKPKLTSKKIPSTAPTTEGKLEPPGEAS